MAYNILFTGTGRRVELIQAFREAALVLDMDLNIFGADMTNTAPALAYCDYVRLVPAIKDSTYIPELLAICEKDEIDILIPTIDTDLMVLAENRQAFEEKGTKVLVSAPEMISVCRDKTVTSSFFKECGLNAPVPVNDWKSYSSGFPAFIKPRDGSSSINAFRVDTQEELETYARQVPDYIVQPFIDGKEYTVDIFCDFDGQPISIVPRIRLQVRTGEVIKTKIDMDDTIIKECRILIEKFKPCGPLTVQLIRDRRSGIDFYIEINPRFGGGSPLSMKAGARSAEALLKILASQEIHYSEQISNGAVYSRFDQSVCIDRGTAEAGIKGAIFDLDDTLYSEKDYVRSGFVTVAEYLGKIEYAEKLWAFFLEGKPAIDTLLTQIGREDEKAEVLSVYRNHIPDITLYKGVSELISRLKKQGKKVGIITDGRPEGQRNKIHALGLEKSITRENIIITDEIGGRQFRKPCDIAFRIIQRRWKIPFEEIIYIGDNLAKDFIAPRYLGMETVYFRNTDGLYFQNEVEDAGNIQTINHFTDLGRII